MGYSHIPEPRNGFHPGFKHAILRGTHTPSILVELHGRLVSGEADTRIPPVDWFWSDAEAWHSISQERQQRQMQTALAAGASTGVLQLPPKANVLYLAAHVMLQHEELEIRLGWLYDIHLLVSRHKHAIDWDEVAQRAEDFHWAGMLQEALARTQECFGTHLPEGFLDILAAASANSAASRFQRPAQALQTRPEVFWLRFVHLSWKGRLLRLWVSLFPNLAYLRWRYHLPIASWLWPLYYLYRWYDLAADTMGTLARRLMQ
jgi:hypothetical protein